ncbi:MAG: thioredoxin [Pseudomonadota bacterium]
MLATDLPHITTDAEFQQALAEHDQLMVCCGRNGPMCLPVYDVMESIQDRYETVAFKVMAFDSAVAHNIKSLPECRSFMGLPFTVYFKGGKVVKATSSIQSKGQVTAILDQHFEG